MRPVPIRQRAIGAIASIVTANTNVGSGRALIEYPTFNTRALSQPNYCSQVSAFHCSEYGRYR
ncbi:hypothetical protein [Rubidibacter lacunae]|uniref:hypothetical protein n=1 Tax=Rubidibacter lacunae TaxID=582514 RepID=UPI0018DB5807|nr:hypothetical protein [Rubidibacter lacunae]